jgi:hypothetical protein
MSDLTDIQADLVSLLEGKAALRGVTILSMDDLEYWKDLGTALSDIHGTAVAVGRPSGVPEAINIRGGQFTTTLRSYIFENPAITRERNLAATVADEAARLALTDIAAGDRVLQSDTSANWWLMEAGQEADASKWAPVLTETQILQLVIRSLQLPSVDGLRGLVCRGFDPGTLDDLHNYVVRFELQIGLDPTAVT